MTSFLTVLSVPVVKGKTGKIFSFENYTPIASGGNCQGGVELILLDRLQEYVTTTGNPFGSSYKHSADLCIYVQKQVVSNRQNMTIFMCVLVASKVFDHVDHSKQFFKLQEGKISSYLIRITGIHINLCGVRVQGYLWCLQGSFQFVYG